MAAKKKAPPPKEIEITIPYNPRPLQRDFHNNAKRWNVAVAHRRFGKTVLALNELIRRLLTADHKDPIGIYVCPTFTQAEKVAWQYVQDFTRVLPDVKYNQAKLLCTFPLPGRGTATIHLLSGGNDAGEQIRGLGLTFVVLDEVADLPEKLFPTIIRPALADKRGGCLWIGTPKGEGPFFEIYEKAKDQVESGDDTWHYCLFRADEISSSLYKRDAPMLQKRPLPLQTLCKSKGSPKLPLHSGSLEVPEKVVTSIFCFSVNLGGMFVVLL